MISWMKWIKIADLLTLFLGVGAVIRAFASNEEFVGILFVAGIIAVRALIVGALYYKDIRRTSDRSMLEAIAHAMFLMKFPFWANAYFQERERALKSQNTNDTQQAA